jgi:hypothetical protein
MLYLAGTCYRASRKLFWFDEFGTIYVARLADAGAIWEALKGGADFNPPLLYLLTKAGEALMGAGHLGARLPEIVGFGVFCLCMFRFVSFGRSATAGLVAMVFPVVTGAYWHAYDARPHAIVLGCCGVAMVCWQASVSNPRRAWWLAGLSCALAFAVLNHAFGVLLFVPLAIAELVRTWNSRKIDWAVWAAFAFASAAVFVLVPLAQAANAGPGGSISFVTLVRLVNTYQYHLAPASLALAALPLLIVVSNPSVLACGPEGRACLGLASAHECALLFAFSAMPIFATMISLLTGTDAFDRYSLSTIAGVAGLVGLVTARSVFVGVGMLAVLICMSCVDFAKYFRADELLETSSSTTISTHLPAFSKRYSLMSDAAAKNEPIILIDNLDFAATFYYAPPDIARRLVYAVFPGDNIGPYFARLGNCCKAVANLATLAEVMESNQRFFVYTHGGVRAAERVQQLVASGLFVSVVSASRNHMLLLVSR